MSAAHEEKVRATDTQPRSGPWSSPSTGRAWPLTRHPHDRKGTRDTSRALDKAPGPSLLLEQAAPPWSPPARQALRSFLCETPREGDTHLCDPPQDLLRPPARLVLRLKALFPEALVPSLLGRTSPSRPSSDSGAGSLQVCSVWVEKRGRVSQRGSGCWETAAGTAFPTDRPLRSLDF